MVDYIDWSDLGFDRNPLWIRHLFDRLSERNRRWIGAPNPLKNRDMHLGAIAHHQAPFLLTAMSSNHICALKHFINHNHLNNKMKVKTWKTIDIYVDRDLRLQYGFNISSMTIFYNSVWKSEFYWICGGHFELYRPQTTLLSYNCLNYMSVIQVITAHAGRLW